jgi:hypothetical protein
MARLRNLKVLVLLFALLALFAGGFTILSSHEAQASYGCCIWVMYCPVEGPGPCWCVCIPVPCW